MTNYIGTKKVKADPMTRGEYNKYRGWKIPKNEDPKEDGYLVEYEAFEGGAVNHKDHEGYITWSPKNAFDRAYSEIVEETFEDRLLVARDELQTKLEGLQAFLGKGQKEVVAIAGITQYLLLEKQWRHMKNYLFALNRRITDLGLDVK